MKKIQQEILTKKNEKEILDEEAQKMHTFFLF